MSPHGSLRTLHLASICKPSTHRNHVFPNIITFQKKKKMIRFEASNFKD